MSRLAPDPSRRAFLRRAIPAARDLPRPPWSEEESLAAACSQCGDCLSACPEAILVRGEGGYPAVDFSAGAGECTFCGACAKACPEPVFDRERSPAFPHIAAIAEESCLAFQGIHCEACRDACPEVAIRFAPRLGGPPQPALDPARCNGCGACLGVCPAGATKLTLQPPSEDAA